ncbi:hypothetical protein GCM10023188_45350 [Pontibacter saemangeumensis]|uniref:Glycosyltransferase 2-like domain-containing protein n=1 Tax=Pontibacter saemangeumensis TaxID=1084525 RepID=A0ABP8M3W8_9BACT
MNPHHPYQITPIYLDKQQALPELDFNRQGHYLVLWWKEIVLGHLFLKPGRPLPEEELYHRLVEAVAPAVAFYAKEQPQNGQWQEWALQNDLSRWAFFLDAVMAPWIAADMPGSVPVTVVICTRNRAGALKHCLDSIKRMACQPAEIIVVDNARENDATESLVGTYDGILYIDEPTPGLSYARNTGLRKASSPIIAYTDDDVLVHQDWIYRVWETFAGSEVAAMTGLVIASELQAETQLIFEKHWSFNRGYTDTIYNAAYFKKHLSKGPPVWRIGAGANMAFRKGIFEEVGLFDERLGAGASGCSEDSEMWYRILLKRHTILYNPRAIAFHRHRQDIKALHSQLYSYMRGFAAAALIQQSQYQQAGYKRRLFLDMPRYYGKLLYSGFPGYRFRFKTLGSEIRGILSGILFYIQHRRRPAYTKHPAQA